MINAVNQTPSFGHRCIVVLPANTDLKALYSRVNIKNPDFNLKFIEPDTLKARKLLEDEFTYVGKSNIKGTDMAKFVFDDGRSYNFQLPAFLKFIFGDSRVVGL